LLACGVILVTGIAVAGNLRHSSHPFKRQVIVPFDEVIEFVHANQSGTTAVLTSDVTVDFLLASDRQLCVMRFDVWDSQWEPLQCSLAAHLDTIIVIKGYPLDEQTPQWKNMVTPMLSRKTLIAEAAFGIDDDAELKRWLTKEPLSRTILSGSVYR
jgi:hypothetical protein